MKSISIISLLVSVFLQVAPAEDTISSNPIWISLNSTPRDTGRFVTAQSVNALAIHDGKLFAGGNFNKISSVTGGGLVQLDNGSWKKVVDVGKYGVINALAFDTSFHLLVGGDIDTSSPVKTSNMFRWDGVNTFKLDYGVREQVRAIAVDQKNNYYVGTDAHVNIIMSIYVNLSVLKWNGTDWSSFYTYPEVRCGSGPCPMRYGCISSIVSDYSKGVFFTGYGCNLPYTGRYNCPEVLAVDFEGNLYGAGDNLIMPYSTDCPGLSKKTWTPSGYTMTDTIVTSIGYSFTVKALATDKKGNLFFGGNFFIQPGARGVAVWNGKTIKPLGKGIYGTVKSLAIDESAGILYVGGDFDSAGGRYSPMIAAVDLYHGAVVQNRQCISQSQSVEELKITAINNIFVVSNAMPLDRLYLYSLSGRLLAESSCAQACQLKTYQSQPIFAVVQRGNKSIIAQKVLVLK